MTTEERPTVDGMGRFVAPRSGRYRFTPDGIEYLGDAPAIPGGPILPTATIVFDVRSSHDDGSAQPV